MTLSDQIKTLRANAKLTRNNVHAKALNQAADLLEKAWIAWLKPNHQGEAINFEKMAMDVLRDKKTHT